ncbi:MAG: DUF1801 domain-containing protein [Chitinophagales bacterium]|nr:DUF1801 domain-containing protein [Bacteroidota bacterium]MCB9042712.1 DUF1801 domain-containing protein [Chitinophagales bacterium]
MSPEIENYFANGCGRCSLGGTPECKVHHWAEELLLLRKIILSTGLKEELKWSVPCYTFQEKNVLLLTAFKEYCAIAFFKGTLLKDTETLLTKPGDNSQAVRQLRSTSVPQIQAIHKTIENYIKEAIELEKQGEKVSFVEKDELIYPEELTNTLAKDNLLNFAFEALTQGRKRGYVLYFAAPKQSKTRMARIQKYKAQILAGKGLHDRD